MPPQKRKYREIHGTRGVHDDTARLTDRIGVRCSGREIQISKPDSFEKFCQWVKRFWDTPMQFEVSLHDPKKPAVEGQKVDSLRVLSVFCDEKNRAGQEPI